MRAASVRSLIKVGFPEPDSLVGLLVYIWYAFADKVIKIYEVATHKNF